MKETDVSADIQKLLMHVLKARTLCMNLRTTHREVFGQSYRTLTEDERLREMMSDAPFPPDISVLPDQEARREAVLDFLANATQFMSKNSTVVYTSDSSLSQQLRAIEEHLDGLSQKIVALKGDLPWRERL